MSLQQHIQKQIQEQCKKHECINLIPAEFADVGVQVACAEGISDLSQKNAKVLVLRVDPINAQWRALEQKLLKSENQPSSQSVMQ